MEILLLRHAEAMAASGRPLTPKGEDQAQRVARFIGYNQLVPEVILSSPVLRASQTAEVVAKYNGCELIGQDWLGCGMSPAVAFAELRTYKALGRVMLVGHEPDFSGLVATLLGMSEGGWVNIRKASLTLIECAKPGVGEGILQFSIPEKHL